VRAGDQRCRPSQAAAAPAGGGPGELTGTGSELLAAFPPRPAAVSWPATAASRKQLLTRLLAPPFALALPISQQSRRLGLVAVVNWLEAQPGGSWQDRWVASGAEARGDWRDLVRTWRESRPGAPGGDLIHIGAGLLVLICADVIRPGIGWLLRCSPAPRNLAAEMARTRDAAAFAELGALCESGSVGTDARRVALSRVAIIMAARGGGAAAITVGDCVELLNIAAGTLTAADRHPYSPSFYQLLRTWGAFGGDAPAAMRVFSGRGQPTCEQLIDRYRIACGPVRDVLVDYLAERRLSLDFSSLQNLAYMLGKLFWADLEAHQPGISSLKLPRDVAASWKQRVMTRTRTTVTSDGRSVQAVTARLNGRSVMTAVRAFYLDIAEWPMMTPPGGGRTRCDARSAPATCPTRKTGRSASPGWTSGPASGCRSCPPWPPGLAPGGQQPPSCCKPPGTRPRARYSPPAARRCAGL
jgi:hypothetical protein